MHEILVKGRGVTRNGGGALSHLALTMSVGHSNVIRASASIRVGLLIYKSLFTHSLLIQSRKLLILRQVVQLQTL